MRRRVSFFQSPPVRSGAVLLSIVIVGSACQNSDREAIAASNRAAAMGANALKGDSLLALAAEIPDLSIDSMRAAIEARMANPEAGDDLLALPNSGASGSRNPGAEVSRRAQARGDSMARAAAAQLAGGAGGQRDFSDSLRGVLTYQGTEPARLVVLKTAETTVALSGMATNGLSRLVGKEVVVHGVKVTPRDIVVSDFVVRAVDGVPAVDGVLQGDGVLRLTDGSGVRRVAVPAPLRPYVGARVWIAVRDGEPATFGVISGR